MGHLKASLGYLASLRPAWAKWALISQGLKTVSKKIEKYQLATWDAETGGSLIWQDCL